jgi:hypothetical protein
VASAGRRVMVGRGPWLRAAAVLAGVVSAVWKETTEPPAARAPLRMRGGPGDLWQRSRGFVCYLRMWRRRLGASRVGRSTPARVYQRAKRRYTAVIPVRESAIAQDRYPTSPGPPRILSGARVAGGSVVSFDTSNNKREPSRVAAGRPDTSQPTNAAAMCADRSCLLIRFRNVTPACDSPIFP